MFSNTNTYGLWNKTLIGKTILEKKYYHEGENFDDFVNRVGGIFSDEVAPKMGEALRNADFFLGGRSIYGAGSKGKFKSSMSNCFIAGHKVITQKGLKNIEDIVIGDKVITDNGTWQRVNEVMSRDYVGDLYEITPETAYDKIVCTPNHNFLTEEGWIRADRLLTASNGRVKSCHKLRVPTVSFEKNYEIIDITEHFQDSFTKLFFNDDKVGYKIAMTNGVTEYFSTQGNLINRYISPDKDFMYFIGRWLGDGSVTTRKGKQNPSILQIVFNATTERNAFEKCKRIGEEKFGIKSSVTETKQNVIALRFENPIISTWFLKEFGQKCDGKFVKDKYVGDFNIALGLLDSDGMIYTHGAVSITLKNLSLITWLRDTLYLNGINCKQIFPTKYERTFSMRIPTGIAKARLNPYLSKTYYDARENIANLNGIEKDFVRVINVRVIENISTKVYNLSVENIHSYTVNGVVCHNCYILPLPLDNLESINEVAGKMARIFSYGGGCGLNISNLRPRGSKVNNSARTSTGAVSFMSIFDSYGGTIGANNRRAALMIGLDCSHPDIEEFLDAKRNNSMI